MTENQENKKNNNNSELNLAIPFITYNESTKKFIINKDAKKIISKTENNKKIK